MQLEFYCPPIVQLLPFPAIPKDTSRMDPLLAQAAGEQPDLTSLLCTKKGIYEHLKDHFPAPPSVTHSLEQRFVIKPKITGHRAMGTETGTELDKVSDPNKPSRTVSEEAGKCSFGSVIHTSTPE